jgi:hypothetical protein
MFSVSDFICLLKDGTLLHHHHTIDIIVHEFVRTSDYKRMAIRLTREVTQRRMVWECLCRAYAISKWRVDGGL